MIPKDSKNLNTSHEDNNPLIIRHQNDRFAFGNPYTQGHAPHIVTSVCPISRLSDAARRIAIRDR